MMGQRLRNAFHGHGEKRLRTYSFLHKLPQPLRKPERAQGSENKLCGCQPVPSLLRVQNLFSVKGENHTSPQDYEEDLMTQQE